MSISKGKTVKIAYDLTVDGQLIKSIGATRPFRYTHGKKQVSRGLEKALAGLKVGDRKEFVVFPKDGYGRENPKSFMEMSKSEFPKKDHFIGRKIMSQKDGKYFGTVKEVRSNTLLLNLNHPFADKKLHYDVVVVGIEGET